MLKLKRLSCTTSTMELTKDGESSMLTNSRNKPRDWLKNSDFLQIDHSTSDPDFQIEEWLSAIAMLTYNKENGGTMKLLSNGSSTQQLR